MAKTRRLMGLLLAVCMLFSMVSIPALAADDTTGGASETVSTYSASKTDELLNRETNRYEVEIQIPGRKPGIVFFCIKKDRRSGRISSLD